MAFCNRYMCSNYSGCSNTSLTNINTPCASDTTTIHTPSPDTTQVQMGQNLSCRLLTEAQVSLLVSGQNYTMVPLYSQRTPISKSLPNGRESPGYKQSSWIHAHKPNIAKDEVKALNDLRQDKDRVILTGNKGVVFVVVDRQDYINEPWTFWHIGTHKDPWHWTSQINIKNKFSNMLRTIKAEGGPGDTTYKRLYLTCAGPQNSMGYQKYTKRTPYSAHSVTQGSSHVWVH